MPVDLFQALAAIESEDGQLKTAAKKLGHEPEMGHMDAAGVTSGIGQAMGRGPMDAKALLDEKALEAAGQELAGRTFQDPRERSGARNLANRAGPGPTSPTDPTRPATKPSNVTLRTGPATHRADSLAKAAGIKHIYNRSADKVRAAAPKVKAFLKRHTVDSKMVGDYKSYGHGETGLRRVGKGLKGVAKENPKTLAGGAVVAGGAGYAVHRSRKNRKKAASLTLARFLEIQGNDAGIKMASEAYGDHEVLARTIQLREAQSVGMKLACGMFNAAAAEAQG